jgi:hypothetical protein
MPAWIVVRDTPAALATRLIPPCPKANASAAKHNRNDRSSSHLESALYFARSALSSTM